MCFLYSPTEPPRSSFTAFILAHLLHKTHISVFVQFFYIVSFSLTLFSSFLLLAHRHSILCDEKSIIDCMCWIFIIIMLFDEQKNRKKARGEKREGKKVKSCKCDVTVGGKEKKGQCERNTHYIRKKTTLNYHFMMVIYRHWIDCG